MRILAVDTSTRRGSLAVAEDERLLGVVSTATAETYSSRMFRQLDFLLAELKLTLAEMDLFAVVAGPGSFTGLRVGLAAVKGWAEVFAKPVAAVSGLEALAAQSRAARVAAVMDARRGQIYGGLYLRTDAGLVRESDDVVMTLDEFLAQLPAGAEADVTFATPEPLLLAATLAATRFASRPVEQVSDVLAPVVARLGLERARRGELLDALALDAHYVRRSDAELLWKG
jgi:tRNA threonylcarbamoyladenosine biosynthesis protein TsaB